MGILPLAFGLFCLLIGLNDCELIAADGKANDEGLHWIAVAALEAEPDSTLLEQLKAGTNKWRKR